MFMAIVSAGCAGSALPEEPVELALPIPCYSCETLNPFIVRDKTFLFRSHILHNDAAKNWTQMCRIPEVWLKSPLPGTDVMHCRDD